MNPQELNEAHLLLKEHHYTKVGQVVTLWPEQEVATLFSHLTHKQSRSLFIGLQREQALSTFPYLTDETQEYILTHVKPNTQKQILESLTPDDRVALLEGFTLAEIQKLLSHLPKDERDETRALLNYPDESVGRIMTPDYVAVQPDWTVGRGLKHLREVGHDSETMHMVYVVDKRGKLLDDIRLRHFILEKPTKKIRDVMDGEFASLDAHQDQEHAVKLMKQYDMFSLPVVSKSGKLVGIVTADDVFDVAEEEATEDIHKIGSVTPLKQSYKHSSIFTLYSRRVWWLSGLVFVSLISAGIIGAFEEVLAGAIALAFFIPLLMASAGNTGAQSATLMVRAIATGDVHAKEWFKVFTKELFVGILLGGTLGFLTWGLGLFRADARIGLIVGLTMVCVIIVANLLGAALPFILTKLKIDPAVASAPLITSIADGVGLIIYFTIATLILGGAL